MEQRGGHQEKELFNGENLEFWKPYNKDSISNQWGVEGGALVFNPADEEREGSENLISENEYENFELSLE